MGLKLSTLILAIVLTSSVVLVLFPMVMEIENNFGVNSYNLTYDTPIGAVMSNLTKTSSSVQTTAMNSTGGVGLSGGNINPNSQQNLNLLSLISAIQYVGLIYTVPKILLTETLLYMGVPAIFVQTIAVAIIISVTLFLLSIFFFREL